MFITINIPEDSRCLLKVGDKIDFNKPFLERKTNQSLDIYIAKELSINPKKIFQALKKFVGDQLKKDEIIAVKKGLFSEKKFLSPVAGIIKEVNHEQGKINIQVDQKDKKTDCSYFKGEVVNLTPTSLELRVKSGEEFLLEKSTDDFGGDTFYLDKEETQQMTTTSVNKKIVFCSSATDLISSKAEALGALGIVATSDNSIMNLPLAKLKNSSDHKKIMTKKFPYCLINKKSCKIYFYI